MSRSDPNIPDFGRLREASEWIQRLSEPDAEAHVDDWLRWCASDSGNLPAFEQMQRLWNAFPARNPHALPAEIPVTFRKHRGKLAAVIAGIALLGGLAGWLALRPQVLIADTPIGEQRHVALPDGTQLDLAPGSQVSARFTPARREVKLERGQAFFAVSHSMRPFTVHVNGLSVTAAGTEFDVRRGPASTVVTVSAGLVNVTPSESEAAGAGGTVVESTQAHAGQRLTFSSSTHEPILADVGSTAAGAWRGGTLEFMGESLEEVVGTLNRYRQPQIVVGPELQQTRFTGTVSPAEVRDWLAALEKIYACKVVDRGAAGIFIQARAYNIARN
ncbi:MAG: FecR domain-containing protein [Proteobacteria bacterium]|nr:FecR domain-containing protein [Pseudomonadota bacterium]